MLRATKLCTYAIVFAIAAMANHASAATLTLSQASSDETDASVLDATLDFNVVGPLLTLTVTNLSDYNINQVFFNATDDVVSLALTSPLSGWSLDTAKHAGGFGVFDYALIGSMGRTKTSIASGESETFLLTIVGTGVDALDFVTVLSTIPTGSTPALAAAKFVQGPNDDSAFGASTEPTDTPVIPLPGAAAMGLSLMAGLGAFRRRIS